jgi:cell pole-organizing protein PopZ
MGWLGGVVVVAALSAAPLAREVAPQVTTRDVAPQVAARDVAPAAEEPQAAAQAQQGAAEVALQDELAAAMSYPSSVCKKKRVDACGCHHVYGVRHCHPDRKGKHCEAIVKAEAPWLHDAPQALKL